MNNRYHARLPLGFLFFSLGLCLALFYGVIFGTDQFTYRDESHFHYPLYQYIQTELEQGRFPLWTPYDNLGQPFFANAALGILYPGKLIFFLPWDYSILFNLYIVGHVFLASATLYHLARAWGIGPWGAILGALAYGYGGTVLGQYCNPTFLAGAAWVPEAILWGDRMLTRRSFRCVLLFSALLAIMLLAGDPQTAFHVGMVVSLLALFRWIRERRLLRLAGPVRKIETALPQKSRLAKLCRIRPGLLGLVVVATFLLTAVQVLPSSEYSRLCNRSGYKNPRSLWEIPGFLMAEDKDLAKDEILFDDSAVVARKGADMADLSRGQRIYNGLFLQGILDAHHLVSYDFSTHPIQFASFFWSRIQGTFFPQNAAWLAGVVQFHKAPNWFSTFYMGVLPCLLALVSLRFRFTPRSMRNNARHGNIRVVWLSWCLVLSLWACLGFHGLGWFFHSLGFSNTIPLTDIPLAPPIGSGYWFLQVFVPGYVQFRYPAKLMALAACPMAMLAAYGFDRVVRFLRESGSADNITPDRSLRWLRRLCGIVAVLSLFLAIPASMRAEWYKLASTISNGNDSGPFQPELARAAVLGSLLQTAAVLALFLVLIRFRAKVRPSVLSGMILMSLAVDLYLSGQSMIIVTDRAVFTREENVVLSRLETEASPVPTRVVLNLKALPRLIQESSPERMAQFATAYRQLMQQQFHYALPRSSGGNMPFAKVVEVGTMLPNSYSQWIAYHLRNDLRYEQNLARLGTKYALMDISMPLDTRQATALVRFGSPEAPTDWPENVVLWKLAQPESRAWIERDGRKVTESIADEFVEILHYEPSRVAIRAVLQEPGTVVLSDQFWPGWKLDIAPVTESSGSQSMKGIIRPIQEIFRGVDLDPGTYILTYRYAPDSFRSGALLSALSWGLLALFLLGRARPRRQKRRSKTSTA